MQLPAGGFGRGKLQGIGSRRLLHVDTGERVPGVALVSTGEYQWVIEPCAMQRIHGLVELRSGRAQANRSPAVAETSL